MSGGYLRRYTDLPALIYLLAERKLTLLDPQSWDDQNDSYYLRIYKEKKALASVLALCFTVDRETYHHWSVFAGGSGGACIEFKRDELLAELTKQSGVRTGLVKYLRLNENRRKHLQVDQLPFLKRHAFKHESEYRVIFQSKKQRLSALDIQIPLSTIARITLSPWLHKSLSNRLKDTLRGIDGCEKLSIVRSTLISNQEWKNLGDAAM